MAGKVPSRPSHQNQICFKGLGVRDTEEVKYRNARLAH